MPIRSIRSVSYIQKEVSKVGMLNLVNKGNDVIATTLRAPVSGPEELQLGLVDAHRRIGVCYHR